ncbi:zinc finger protein 408 isoform X2 [Bombina bombina]|uniref:zinc finger protein 408 isoform X2 n=1 Tax=Bombina bombina TaxID=8345 RepID=UPI00235B0FB3|nr:zinc finger protein 408 isoform X2 [Bombina bombina]
MLPGGDINTGCMDTPRRLQTDGCRLCAPWQDLLSLPPGLAVGPSLSQKERLGLWCVGEVLNTGSLLPLDMLKSEDDSLGSTDTFNPGSVPQEASSKWLRFVRSAKQHNVRLYRFNGDLYLQIINSIPPGSELLLHHEDHRVCARHLGETRDHVKKLSAVTEDSGTPSCTKVQELIKVTVSPEQQKATEYMAVKSQELSAPETMQPHKCVEETTSGTQEVQITVEPQEVTIPITFETQEVLVPAAEMGKEKDVTNLIAAGPHEDPEPNIEESPGAEGNELPLVPKDVKILVGTAVHIMSNGTGQSAAAETPEIEQTLVAGQEKALLPITTAAEGTKLSIILDPFRNEISEGLTHKPSSAQLNEAACQVIDTPATVEMNVEREELAVIQKAEKVMQCTPNSRSKSCDSNPATAGTQNIQDGNKEKGDCLSKTNVLESTEAHKLPASCSDREITISPNHVEQRKKLRVAAKRTHPSSAPGKGERCKNQVKVSKQEVGTINGTTKPSRTAVKDKVLQTQTERRFQCPDCGKSFFQLSHLKRHGFTHSGQKPFMCKDCGKAYSSEESFKAHVLGHLGLRPFKCSLCDKAYGTQRDLREHSVLHTGLHPFRCEDCGKSFARRPTLHIHRKNYCVHSRGISRPPLHCSVCNKELANSSSLRIHMRLHTGERPYTCPDCGKDFRHKGNLQIHTRLHTGEKPYKCQYCGDAFPQRPDLKRHLIMHTGEMHLCTVCGKKLKDPHTLRAHEQLHTGNRPFLCQYCGKSYPLATKLRRHLKSHLEEKPFRCQVCGMGYTLQHSLKRHLHSHKEKGQKSVTRDSAAVAEEAAESETTLVMVQMVDSEGTEGNEEVLITDYTQNSINAPALLLPLRSDMLEITPPNQDKTIIFHREQGSSVLLVPQSLGFSMVAEVVEVESGS